LGLEVAKRAVEFSIGLREVSDWTLEDSAPFETEDEAPKVQPSERNKVDSGAYGPARTSSENPLGTSGLKE
jgi:hypothetical protein